MHKFKYGEAVRCTYRREEYGTIVAISGNCYRVVLQSPLGKLWWFDEDELELY